MPRTLRSLVRLSLPAGAGGMLLASAACFPWPARSRAFYTGAMVVDSGWVAEVRPGGETVFERCIGTFTHPVTTGNCLYLMVPRERVVEGAELAFPGDGARAMMVSVGIRGSSARAATSPTGRMRIRQVRPDRIVADVDVTGQPSRGATFVVRDRIGFRATEIGAHPFLP